MIFNADELSNLSQMDSFINYTILADIFYHSLFIVWNVIMVFKIVLGFIFFFGRKRSR